MRASARRPTRRINLLVTLTTDPGLMTNMFTTHTNAAQKKVNKSRKYNRAKCTYNLDPCKSGEKQLTRTVAVLPKPEESDPLLRVWGDGRVTPAMRLGHVVLGNQELRQMCIRRVAHSQ